ncbi:MAG: RNA methyltransferase [bacterium]
MLTKGRASTIKQLHDKKYRQKTGLFLVEGEKSVVELINSDYQVSEVLATKDFLSKYRQVLNTKQIRTEAVEQGELEKVSSMESNSATIAIAKQKPVSIPTIDKNEITIALDEIRDPGNLGTIIRIADWYGIKKIIAAIGTVDLYNPKVISATKGSFTRVELSYVDLKTFLPTTKVPILGTFLDGEDVHTLAFPANGILLMGNESNGINREIEKIVTKKITIPAYGRTESLNVAIATAICLDNWKRNLSK